MDCKVEDFKYTGFSINKNGEVALITQGNGKFLSSDLEVQKGDSSLGKIIYRGWQTRDGQSTVAAVTENRQTNKQTTTQDYFLLFAAKRVLLTFLYLGLSLWKDA